MNKEEFVSIARQVSLLQAKRKEILEDINGRIKDLASVHNINPSHLKQAIKAAIKYEEDKVRYLETDASVDSLLSLVIADSSWR